MPAWKESGPLDKGLTVTLVASFIVASGTLAFVILTPRPGEAFTEFYVLGPGGTSSGYPITLNLSEPGTVIVGIANHEIANIDYAVRIDLVGVRLVYNTSSKSNETVEINRTTWSTLNVTLDNGRNWTQPYTFRINQASLWKVQFLLFKGGDYSKVYREVHLYVRVR